jgi:hypothetical protein
VGRDASLTKTVPLPALYAGGYAHWPASLAGEIYPGHVGVQCVYWGRLEATVLSAPHNRFARPQSEARFSCQLGLLYSTQVRRD